MKTIFLIQDSETKEYYFSYRIEEGFISNKDEAKIFNSEEEIIEELQKDYLKELFLGRTLEVKKYYSF